MSESFESKKRKPRKDLYFKRPHLLELSHEEEYNKQRRLLSNINILLSNTQYNDKIKEITKQMEFVRAFTTKGVQGIVGFVKLEEYPVVFKISVDINKSVEHEFQVLEDLNDLRKYCPHFVRSIGMSELPISADFISDSYSYSLFDEEGDTLPRNVMFMEYVNKLPFYRLCQDTSNKNIIISQVIQVLLALEISQVKKKFTHYDLHTSNILIQMCEKNSVFIYKINNKKFAIPTYGFFPLLIDTGISYAKCLEGKQMMSNTNNYDHGFQTTVFDKLNDVHHFLLTAFYYIEADSDAYDSLSNKMKIIFRHLPVLRKSGWKKLPNDLSDIVILKLMDDCRLYRKFVLFDEYDKPSLEILNNLITLPIKYKGNTDFEDCFTTFMKEYHKIIDIDDFTEHDVLFVLKTIVDLINKYREKYLFENKREKIIDSFKEDFEECISIVLQHNVNYDIDYERLLVSGVVFSERLESLYFELIEENNELIDKVYKKTIVQSPVDMVYYIGKNLTPHYTLDNETIVYYWNSDEERQNKVTCRSLSTESLRKVNMSHFVNKADILLNELKLS